MIITSQGKTRLQYTLNLWIWFCPLQNGYSYWYQAISEVKYHTKTYVLCILSTICYTEMCLLFEFGLGKLIHACRLTAESYCQEIFFFFFKYIYTHTYIF